jgi:NADH dehydrogenase FAD-containing subunit
MDAGHFSQTFLFASNTSFWPWGGGEIDLRTVPGMPEHAYLMQNTGDAVARIKGFQMSGFAAWWLWRTIYLIEASRHREKAPSHAGLDAGLVFFTAT